MRFPRASRFLRPSCGENANQSGLISLANGLASLAQLSDVRFEQIPGAITNYTSPAGVIRG